MPYFSYIEPYHLSIPKQLKKISEGRVLSREVVAIEKWGDGVDTLEHIPAL